MKNEFIHFWGKNRKRKRISNYSGNNEYLNRKIFVFFARDQRILLLKMSSRNVKDFFL